MKKGAAIFLMVFVTVFAVSVYSYADDALTKLGRGISNVVTSVLEVPKGVQDSFDENGMAAAMTCGPLQGVYKGVKRALVGFFEIMTFPLPVPENYAPIIDDPEYFFKVFR
ncbi:MAG: exosortase system-associated protein, TIGR04073 family [Candidatus Omnitrophota bacterium]